MAARAAAARQLPARPVRSRPQPVRRPRAQRRTVAGGLVWIAVLAVLLAGVVALNVALLRLNVRLDRLNQERATLHAENAALASQLAAAAASPRIQALARSRGLVPAQPADTTYLELPAPGR
jgi:cell division protein FtsL